MNMSLCTCAIHRPALVAGLLVAALGWGPLLAQEEAAPPAPPPGETERLIKLNEGIQAYLDGLSTEQFDEARRILEELRAEDPDNAAALYYLGLIYLSEGLKASGQAAAAADDEERLHLMREAREYFGQARDALSRVVTLGEQQLVPIEALLDLGTAYLAAQPPDASRERAAEIARQSVRTLEQYVESPYGQNDFLGHFYLAIAYYRAEEYAERPDYLQRADEALRRALELAEQQDLLTPQQEAPIRYYQSLVALRGRQRAEAIDRMQQSVDLAEGRLRENARELLDMLRASAAAEPTPMNFDTPLGPWRLEGEVAVGAFYDSNVILLGKDTDLPRGIPQKHDWRGGVDASFDFTRLLLKGEDPIPGESLLIGIGGYASHFWQPHIREFDLNTYSGRAYVNWEPIPTFFMGLQYDYTYTMLGHEPYISSNRLTPVLTKYWLEERDGVQRQRARTDLYYSYDYRNYLDILSDFGFDRDGSYHAVGLNQQFNLVQAGELWPTYYGGNGGEPRDGLDDQRWLRASVGYVFRNESTNGEEFDLSGHSIVAELQLPLPYRLEFGVDAEWTWDDYWQRSLFDFEGKERFDFIQRYDFGLTRTLVGRGEDDRIPTLQILVRGGVELTFADSNIWDRLHEKIYEYDRAIYSVKLIVRF